MRRGTEAGKSQYLAVRQTGKAQRSPPDRAGAEQWRCFGVRQRVGNGMRECRGHNCVLGVSTVNIAARRLELRTEIFHARSTPAAMTVSRVDPRDAHAVAFPDCGDALTNSGDAANHLMSRNHWISPRHNPSFDDIEVGSTNGTNRHPHQQLFISWRRGRNLSELERRRIARVESWL